jgi:hypothetical protein
MVKDKMIMAKVKTRILSLSSQCCQEDGTNFLSLKKLPNYRKKQLSAFYIKSGYFKECYELKVGSRKKKCGSPAV